MSCLDASPSATAELSAWLDTLLVQLATTQQRRLLLVAGEAAWCHARAQQMMEHPGLSRVCWVSRPPTRAPEMVSASAAIQLLGQERDAVVFDAHAGFDADAFAAISGVIRGGGLMLLLCPPLAQWPAYDDPAAQRIAIWPHDYADVSGRFLQRLVQILGSGDEPLRIQQGESLPPLGKGPAVPPLPEACADVVFRTQDQADAVAAIARVLHGPGRRPLVLEADRGRGKTAALGIAAARLLQQSATLRILVTAPRLAALGPLFEQAQRLLPEASMGQGRLRWQAGEIQFLAPDVLCQETIAGDLLLVDEAAAIPTGLLQSLLARYSRLVFSTTTQGYEGTGRGFALRFKQTLDAQTPGWKALRLHTPVRWAPDDPLERLVFKMLLLDAVAADHRAVAGASVGTVQLEKLSRDQWLTQEHLLSQLFGLLVVAHYRTRPNDLRNLLDGPGLSVYVTRFRGQVVAAALVASEGGFDEAITQAIYTGQRRPRGHLLPQSLVAHAGLHDAGALRCARIMRLAVHPALQRRGLGRQLLQRIIQDAQAAGVDLLGVSFGATPGLMRFWASEQLLPVRLGFRRDHASGEHSVMMLRALSRAGSHVYDAARTRYLNDLPVWLADPLASLEVSLVAESLQARDAERGDALGLGHDDAMLLSFARGERSYEDALGPIWRLLQRVQRQSPRVLRGEAGEVLLAKVAQRQPWATVAKQFALAGRAGVLTCLRQAVSCCLQALERERGTRQ